MTSPDISPMPEIDPAKVTDAINLGLQEAADGHFSPLEPPNRETWHRQHFAEVSPIWATPTAQDDLNRLYECGQAANGEENNFDATLLMLSMIASDGGRHHLVLPNFPRWLRFWSMNGLLLCWGRRGQGIGVIRVLPAMEWWTRTVPADPWKLQRDAARSEKELIGKMITPLKGKAAIRAENAISDLLKEVDLGEQEWLQGRHYTANFIPAGFYETSRAMMQTPVFLDDLLKWIDREVSFVPSVNEAVQNAEQGLRLPILPEGVLCHLHENSMIFYRLEGETLVFLRALPEHPAQEWITNLR